MRSHPALPGSLREVLVAAAKAPGNQQRFAEAGLINETGQLVADWQAAFARLQPLTKADVRSHPGNFLAQASDVVYRGKTSGTQSEAFTYFAGKGWNQKRLEARSRSLAWWGIDQRIPLLNLASRLSPVRSQDISLVGSVDDEFLTVLLSLIQREPIVLRGYPSRLCEVAIALHHCQRPFDPQAVIAVIATGEVLFDFQRDLLTQTFRAPVINEYGCQEAGMSGMSCPEANRLHLDCDRALYEVMDGQCLITDLHNTTMPMVRYCNGDMLHFFDDPCPCGRPGPTVRILGRAEDAFVLNGQSRWPGELEFPAFPGILAYQLQVGCKRRRLLVKPTATGQPDLAPLKAWLEDQFGPGDTEVLLESPVGSLIVGSDPVPGLAATDSATWLQQVINQAWTSWVDAPLATGEGREIATLLKQLIAPRQIVSQGLPAQTCQLIHSLQHSSPARDSQIEAMKLRVLLWAIGLMPWEDPIVEAKAAYQALLARFHQWREDSDSVALSQTSALGFDLLAPLLNFNPHTAEELWPLVQDLIQRCWPQGLQADRFTVHHYLASLDRAGQLAQQPSHPWVPALRPLAAILLGDFYHFAAKLDGQIVATWAEIMGNCPGAIADGVAEMTNFDAVWRLQRQALLQCDRATVESHLVQLFNLAQSPTQLARCWLEQGYAALVFGDPFDLVEWTEILQQQMVVSSPRTSTLPADAVSNPLPWVPILNALAPQFAEAGQQALAYACLFAAAPPNRHLSNFDRQTEGVNGKQSVVCTLSEV